MPRPGQRLFFGDRQFEAGYDLALQRLARLGCEIVEIDIEPFYETARLLYEGPWVAERTLAARSLLASDPDAIHPVTREIILSGLRPTALDAFAAFYKLEELRRVAEHTFRSVDVLALPTAPTAYTVKQVLADPIQLNSRLGTYTNFVNLLGWCALALPAGRTDRGLPFGVTFIAPGTHDAALVELGRHWEGSGAAAADTPMPAIEPTLPIAVVGAHLSGLPLNGQLLERGAVLREATRTAPHYRLYALPGTQPPKPGLVRQVEGGTSIELEVWELPLAQAGSFLALVPAPLCLGSLELADGRHVHGFLCEAHAVIGATDISAHGGWRAYLAGR
jgi:allophanate hydrolase